MANRTQWPWRLAKTLVLYCTLLTCWLTLDGQQLPAQRTNELLASLRSPVLFHGDATTAYRDPAAVYHDGWIYLYFTLARTESPDGVFLYVAWSKSQDLLTWTEPKILTPKDKSLNFSSPGDVVRIGDEWILCLQSYPRPAGQRYGTDAARLWIMRSKDLEHWGEPELLRVKGPQVPPEKMGRMIDPFLVEDKDEPGKWWCLYKQHGMSRSWSRDLKTWTFAGSSRAGENACVVRHGGKYALFSSPKNGISVKQSDDLRNWQESGRITLGQKNWSWARGRLTAGFVLDAREVPGVGKYLLFFHGSRFGENDKRGGFDNLASIGMAWSDDLSNWDWPGKHSPATTVQ